MAAQARLYDKLVTLSWKCGPIIHAVTVGSGINRELLLQRSCLLLKPEVEAGKDNSVTGTV